MKAHSLANYTAGRIGGANIEFIRVGEETRLGACYQQIPMRIMPPFSFDGEPACLAYMITLTTGLLDGDGHLLRIHARQGTRTVLTGQSASRIHPAQESFSTQQWEVNVEDDAILVVLPGPNIPYRGSRFFQRGRIRLAPRARIIWGDIWLPGRYDRGQLSEKFEFDRVIQDFEVTRAEQLIYRDRFCWTGPWSQKDVDWHNGGFLASASLFVSGSLPDALPEATRAVRRSVLRLGSGDHCIRWCGAPGAVTTDVVQMAMRIAANWAGGPEARPWLIKNTDLASNHWFSTPPIPSL